MFAPVKTPVVVIMAAPPAPAKKPVVPEIPTVAKAAPSPAPMTGASRPADNPITRPPPNDQLLLFVRVGTYQQQRDPYKRIYVFEPESFDLR
jgi:hypothetical protein